MLRNLGELLKSDLNELNEAFKRPRIYLVEYFNNLRSRIDIDCELFIQANVNLRFEVIKQQTFMVNELDKLEQVCLKNLPTDHLKDDVNEKIKKNISTIQSELKLLDAQNGQILNRIDELIYRTWTLLEKELFSNTTVMYLSREDLKRVFIEIEFYNYSTGDSTRVDTQMDSTIEKLVLNNVSFGVLYIVKNEFYSLKRINFEE